EQAGCGGQHLVGSQRGVLAAAHEDLLWQDEPVVGKTRPQSRRQTERIEAEAAYEERSASPLVDSIVDFRILEQFSPRAADGRKPRVAFPRAAETNQCLVAVRA